jgi:hypothetical protein
MERPKPMKTEQTWNGLYPAADDDDDHYISAVLENLGSFSKSHSCFIQHMAAWQLGLTGKRLR